MKLISISILVLIGCVLLVDHELIGAPVQTTIPVLIGKAALARILSLRDSRKVRDADNLHLEYIKLVESWVIGKVKPDKDSFRGRIVGGYFDTTRKWVQEPGIRTHMVIREYGTIEPISIISGNTAAPTSYQWEYDEWLANDSNEVEEGKSAIFRYGSGGTAIFRIDANAQGRDILRPAYLLNDEWVPFVASAFKYAQANKEVFDADTVREHREQLQELLIGPNPLLCVAAARTLSDAHQLNTEFIQTTLPKINGLGQAVAIYLVLKQLPKNKPLGLGGKPTTSETINTAIRQAVKEETLVIELAKFIDNAKDSDTLKAATIALTASLEASQSQVSVFTIGRASDLLHHVIARQKMLGTHNDADTYIEEHPVVTQMLAQGQ
ncbi:hypothetical protein IAD21_04982 [Abditibacteriota bacterium]|nr:hypothetical protein IAD21_04982 [Abditibacteriota bacterium]